jgi:chemotaxis-related protein WspD
MAEPRDDMSMMPVPSIDDCWNKIGIRGNGSCPELRQHVHCRNCPRYSSAAAVLLDRALPDGELPVWQGSTAAGGPTITAKTESVLLFRVGAEWLGMPSAAVTEIVEQRKIHSLPHQRDQAVLGIVNIRGALVLCMSLAQMLGIDDMRAAGLAQERSLYQPMLVTSHSGNPVVFPVAEVHGIHRFSASELTAVPTTVSRTAATYTKAVLPWQGKTVGVLDDGLLFYALNRSLA